MLGDETVGNEEDSELGGTSGDKEDFELGGEIDIVLTGISRGG